MRNVICKPYRLDGGGMLFNGTCDYFLTSDGEWVVCSHCHTKYKATLTDKIFTKKVIKMKTTSKHKQDKQV